MTIAARFDGRAFVPDHPVDLPVGSIVQVSLPHLATPGLGVKPLLDLVELLDQFEDLPDPPPSDLATEHDHYLYGTPKRS